MNGTSRPKAARPEATRSLSGTQAGAGRRPTARCACRACDRRFASTASFDAHRRGRHDAPSGSLEGRHCGDPAADGRFAFVEGSCSLDGSEREVEIWYLVQDRARITEHFGADTASASHTDGRGAHL